MLDLLVQWNETQVEYPKTRCIHQLICEQVKLNPDNIAVVFEDKQLTYQQLYTQSHALALYLQSKGVKPDTFVGLCVERSIDMMVNIVGILLSGGAYVPLDPLYPDDRLAYMLQDAQAVMVLTQPKLKSKLQDLLALQDEAVDVPLVVFNGEDIAQSESCLDCEQTQLRDEVSADNLAYVVYTSGSTGRPKGVMVEHRNAINLLCAFEHIQRLGNNRHCAAWTNVSFDVSVYELLAPLTCGSALYPVPDDVRMDTDLLFAWLVKNRIDSAYIPVFFLPEFKKFLATTGYKMYRLLIGVESVESTLAQDIQALMPDCCIINGYGPSETTIFSTLYVLKPGEQLTSQIVPIGGPVINTQTYILDDKLQPVPIGAEGELYIAGDGVSRGYLNQPQLTEKAFLPNPFNPGTRMYKTGDMTRARTVDDDCIDSPQAACRLSHV